MKVEVVGSRSITQVDLGAYLPVEVTEIVSGGARGVDRVARQYAEAKGLVYTELLPNYPRYGKAAPLVRNRQMIAYADCVIALWDGQSRGTRFVVESCHKQKIPCRVCLISK